MEIFSNAIYILLFALFIVCTFAKKHMYAAFIFLLLPTSGLSFLTQMTFLPRLIQSMCVVIFCTLNFKLVKRNIKKDRVVRGVFHLCLFFIFAMAFSILYWKLPPVPVIKAGIYYMMPLSIFVFIPLSRKQFHKLFTIIYYVTFVATVLYIIQCFIGRAILPISFEQEKVGLITEYIYRFWITPPFMIELIPISIFCKKIVPLSLRAISPVVFVSGLFCTMYRTHIAAMILCIFLLMWLTGSFVKNFKSVMVLLIIFAIFGTAFTERVTRGNNATERDIGALIAGDFSMARANVGNGMTLMYRAGWVLERIVYVLHSPVELFMGFRLTDDVALLGSVYNFAFGIRRDYGIEQVTTPDIAYGMLVTRYGLIGTFFLLRMIFRVLRRLYRYRRRNELSMALFGFICSQFVAAVSSTVLVDPQYWITIFFLYDYAMKMIEDNIIAHSKMLPATHKKSPR